MAGSTIGGSGRRKGANPGKRAWWAAASVRTPPRRIPGGSVRVYAGFAAASGQRSRMRPRSMYSGTNTRVRHETISVVQPMRLSAARSPSAGPSISTRTAPIRRRLARRQPLARSKDAPRVRIASCISAELMTGPPASPKASRKACACSGVRTRPSRLSPASVASRRTRMFSPGSRSHMGSSRPVTSHRRDSVWLGSPSISASHNARQRSSPRILPVRGGKFLRGHGLAGGGTDQADPGLDPAVLEHPRRRGQNHGGALRAGVDDGPPVAQGEGIIRRSGTSRSRRTISTSSVAAPEAS